MQIDDLSWRITQRHKALLLERLRAAVNRCRAIKWDRFVVISLLALIPFVIGVDYAFLLGVFDYLLPDETGNGDIASEAYLLACAGIIAILAWHAITYRTRSERFEHTMGIMARVFLPIFLIGSGLLLAAVLYANGLDTFAQPQLQDQVRALLGETIETSERPALVDFWEEQVQPVFPVVFAMGLAGLFFLSAFLGHVMTLEVARRAPAFFLNVNEASEIRSDIELMEENEKKALAIKAKLVQGAGQIDDNRADTAIHTVLANAEPDLAEVDRVITVRELNPNPSDLDIVHLRAQAGISPDVWGWDLGLLKERAERNRDALTFDRVRALMKHS
jgi:hypothetical protein